MAKRREFKPGDRVTWETPQGRQTGAVLRKATTRLQIQNFEVFATPDNPSFLVRVELTGEIAALSGAVLRRMPAPAKAL